MKLVLLFCLLPAASAFGKTPDLYLHPDVGWCQSELDETPCSFDCPASFDMDDDEIAEMCYEACVTDYPNEVIENVEYYPGGCYCQTSCPSMECGSNTATLTQDYYLPDCDVEDDYDDYDDDDDEDYSCLSPCVGESEYLTPQMLCANYTTCATTCDDDLYDDIHDYCMYDFCVCDDRRRLDASPKANARQTKKNFERKIKKISDLKSK